MSDGLEVGINVMVHPEGRRPLDTAVWAEERGYPSIWMTDGGGRMDSLTLAAAIGVKTSRIRIGLSVVPVFTRPPAVLATSAVTLADVATDRIVLGLGTSSETMVEGWYGTPFVKPLARVRETVSLLRRILAGEKVEFEGETVRSHGFKLGSPLRGRIPIFVAALQPRMLELAGEVADGVILNLAPVEALPRLLEHIDTGAKRCGRRVEDLEIASMLNTFVADDPAPAVEEMRRIALGYYSTGVYNRHLAWLGYADEARRISEGFEQRDRAKTRSAADDELVMKVGVIGTASECCDRLAAYSAAGLDTAIVTPASPDDDVYQATIEAFAPTP